MKEKKCLIFNSLLLSFFLSFFLKEAFSFLFLGKAYSNRSLPVQIGLFFVLLVVILFFLFLLFRIIQTKNKKSKIIQLFSSNNDLGIIIIFFAVFIHASIIATKFSNQPLLEEHGFRQTQTALSAYWIIQEGWKLAYQTPVLGYPWSLPFEFPVYQLFVAFISTIFNFPLDATGRLTSFFFLILCAIPLFSITKKLELSKKLPWIICILLWSSPLYLLWGRSFLIETMALFFSLMAISYMIDFCADHINWRSVLKFTFWATLGMLQKSTTMVPILFLLGLVILIHYVKSNGFFHLSWNKTLKLIIAFLIPLILGFIWVRYSDQIKALNPIGIFISSKELSTWNFGTLQQRIDPQFYKDIFYERIFVENAGSLLGIFIILVSLFIKGSKKFFLSISLALFVFPIMVFSNLHFVHNYYQTSCAIFLFGALAYSVIEISKKTKDADRTTNIILLLLIFSNYAFFARGNLQIINKKIDRNNSRTIMISEIIDKYTPPKSAIAVFGNDWSSEFAYYSHRKSISVPHWFIDTDRIYLEPTKYLGGLELGAIVFCGYEDPQQFSKVISQPNVKGNPAVYKIENCYLWMNNINGDIYTLDYEPLSPEQNKAQ